MQIIDVKTATYLENLAGRIHLSRVQALLVCFGLSITIGIFDYLLGSEVSPSSLYGLPVYIAAWFIGLPFAIVLAIVNVTVWLGLNHQIFVSTGWIGAAQTGIIRLLAFSFFAVILVRLNFLQKNLKSLAEARARALMGEVEERIKLERDLVEISERERFRIGRDLHDGLCQHLAGMSLLTQSLSASIAAEDEIKKGRADKIVSLLREAVALARATAKGLHPIELQADGLMRALEEHADTVSRLFSIDCRFDCPNPVFIYEPATSAHLFRITQEAVGNAIRHGGATEIVIGLEEGDNDIQLVIRDNGCGINGKCNPGGIGLRSMTTRAKFMRGSLTLSSDAPCGTIVNCIIPGEGNAGRKPS